MASLIGVLKSRTQLNYPNADVQGHSHYTVCRKAQRGFMECTCTSSFVTESLPGLEVLNQLRDWDRKFQAFRPLDFATVARGHRDEQYIVHSKSSKRVSRPYMAAWGCCSICVIRQYARHAKDSTHRFATA